MNIGRAAEASGVSAKMIRYYEDIGLIEKPARTAAGYRRYSEAEVNTLSFIRRARNLGFSVEEIRALLALWRDRSRASSDVKALAMKHIADLNTRIAELKEMADTLDHLARNCHGDDRPHCPILESLAAPVIGETQPREGQPPEA
ncbi:Cu(I)-responsive transcriptional regulator [Acuticoccus sp. M5D2P5]|uniref:Cu(I)-responsive transcriptional regulator n=1 Tax=Acuticoccus kalidii TaxID=2910977 RepID=UPI001F469ED1|nr:Cu(I)-responsive transcriptional regulator [Acuticoccus kalidii]MCF3934609.1 Cu(I)-responsive transcriptional regulator [Acuticoccus kalidii]